MENIPASRRTVLMAVLVAAAVALRDARELATEAAASVRQNGRFTTRDLRRSPAPTTVIPVVITS
ncbi:hypothetical protein [Leifsonia sp. A12D58]|uniref:hypothetical protein n=1 Tax=Leifsonia sp. A12D58 TaxID=3397674 RepID=UPI0039E051F0